MIQDLEGEEWRDIPDYDGYYQVSNMGRVKSLARWVKLSRGEMLTKERVLKPKFIRKKFEVLNLTVERISKTFYIPRLVALCFLNGFSEDKYVHHLDGNSLNNNVENLTLSTEHPSRVLTIEQAEQVKEKIQNGKSSLAISKEFKISENAVRQIKSGKTYKNK